MDDANNSALQTAHSVLGISTAANAADAAVQILVRRLSEARAAISSVQSEMNRFLSSAEAGSKLILGSLGNMKSQLEDMAEDYSTRYSQTIGKTSSAGTEIRTTGVKNNGVGSIIISRSHVGEPIVTKETTPLDKALGVGPDETLRILKVGEAVIPPEENLNRIANKNLSLDQNVSKVASKISDSHNSVSNYNNAGATNFNFGDIIVQGNADQNTVEALRKERETWVQTVFEKIEKHSKQSGFRNMKLFSM